VGYEQFLLDFRHINLVQYVSFRVNPTAAGIVKVMLEQYPRQLNATIPVLDELKIFQLLESTEDAPRLTTSECDAYLDELSHESVGVLIGRDKGYIVNIEGLVNEMKEKHAQSLIKERFGVVASRIFKLLIANKQLEEKQIAELATASKVQARELLYRLYREGWIGLQEVPRSADRNLQRTFFLWNVNLPKVYQKLLDSYMFTWCNVKLRLDVETKKAQPLIDKVNASETITEQERLSVTQFKVASDRMEHALIQLDSQVMLFREFWT